MLNLSVRLCWRVQRCTPFHLCLRKNSLWKKSWQQILFLFLCFYHCHLSSLSYCGLLPAAVSWLLNLACVSKFEWCIYKRMAILTWLKASSLQRAPNQKKAGAKVVWFRYWMNWEAAQSLNIRKVMTVFELWISWSYAMTLPTAKNGVMSTTR